VTIADTAGSNPHGSFQVGSRIGALSRSANVHIETIRYYERIGLLAAPTRTAAGYRSYGLEHLKRLSFIRRARELGFSLDEVRALLRLVDQPGRSCVAARELAEHHLAEVRAKIADLRAMEGVLKTVVARCKEGNPPDCPLIESLFR
jgi:MerR family mercuric resistance operon transcriptional regulator